MAQFTTKQHIAAPLDRMFEVATDFGNAPRYMRGIAKMELVTDGPVQVGTRFRETRIMFGKEATEEMEITAFDPPHGYALGCESCGCRYHSEFTFRAANGGTDVEMTFNATPMTFLARTLGIVFRPMLKLCMKAVTKDLEDLKESIEKGNEVAPV